jgi:predicted ester cyclase
MDVHAMIPSSNHPFHSINNSDGSVKENSMASTENLAVVRRMLDVIATGKTADLAQIVAPNWANHDPNLPPMQGLEGAKQLVNMWHTGFPDMKFTIEDSLCEGDKVALRFRLVGKNTGAFMNMDATGKSVNGTGTGIFKVVNGKLTDNWVNFDALGVMQQLGFVPVPERAG